MPSNILPHVVTAIFGNYIAHHHNYVAIVYVAIPIIFDLKYQKLVAIRMY